ncbi:MAG: enoyl-CoA hydratase/isomerase family protein [Burkholderiales bacterium]
MAGSIDFNDSDTHGVAVVTLSNPGKLNAIDISMWRELRRLFDDLQARPAHAAPRAVIVAGAGGHFASGGDIHEFASFRFDEIRLHDFHEHTVAPALHAMLACDIPLVAQIDGACIGGGLEIAACCDIRLCGESSRFGAPIAKLGFPMAPGELALLYGVTSAALLREMLLEARLLDAAAALQHGLVHTVVPDDAVAAQAARRAAHIAALSPQAARINKQTLRQLAAGGPSELERRAHFAYADSPQHREGVTAFIEKRPARFQRG